MNRYVVMKSGSRWVVYSIMPPSYNHPEPRKAIIARRDTREQAQGVMDDLIQINSDVERVLAARLLGGNQ
jgi:hypothetical protein